MLPKAELHIHIEGTLEPELLVEVARRNGITVPDAAALRAQYNFADLQAFLDLYYRNVAVLRTARDFYELMSAYLTRAARDGVRRAEIFFDPQQHVAGGVRLDEVFDGLSSAIQDHAAGLGISAALILSFLRDRPVSDAQETLTAALAHRDRFIGVGLDSAELGYPPRLFADVFARAAAEGLHRVAHAGEEAGPDYVREALDVLGAERIDHGIRAIEDAELVARLRDEQTPLTVCPLSNLALHCVPSMAEHPLARMLDAGLRVSVNSDDPAYFGGYIEENFVAAREAFGLTTAQLTTLAANSFDACFAEPSLREGWLAEVASAG